MDLLTQGSGGPSRVLEALVGAEDYIRKYEWS
jgi:hypothetical protein